RGEPELPPRADLDARADRRFGPAAIDGIDTNRQVRGQLLRSTIPFARAPFGRPRHRGGDPLALHVPREDESHRRLLLEEADLSGRNVDLHETALFVIQRDEGISRRRLLADSLLPAPRDAALGRGELEAGRLGLCRFEVGPGAGETGFERL